MRKFYVLWCFLACHSITTMIEAGITKIPNETITTTEINNIEAPEVIVTSKDKNTKIVTDDDDDFTNIEVKREEKTDDYSVEEKQDENEFIFIKGNQKIVLHDLLGQDSNKVDSTTKILLRAKRSDNIILEENLGTTLSGFQYTGRDVKLNNELYFKNINS